MDCESKVIDFGAAGDCTFDLKETLKGSSTDQNPRISQEHTITDKDSTEKSTSMDEGGSTLSLPAVNERSDKLLIQIDPVCKESLLPLDMNTKSSTAAEEVKSLISDNWYTNEVPDSSGCPFKSLHHAGLEFLHFPLSLSNKRSKRILSGMNDFSSSVCVKLQFIVNNLRDCQGIWQQLFMQKLNTMLIHADQAVIRTALCKDNFATLKTLVEYFTRETKCSMVFRYWCFFYNIFSKGLIQVLPIELKNQLLNQLQRDFNLATQNSCRCKVAVNCCSECKPDEEHRIIDGMKQMKIISVLLYYLICKLGNYSNNASDVYKNVNIESSEKFIKETLIKLYIKLYEKVNSCPINSQDGTDNAAMMETLCHLLIACHTLPLKKNIFANSVQQMLDMGCLTSAQAVKETLLNLFQKECETIIKAAQGVKLIFTLPDIKIGFVTLGISSVINALVNVISLVEYELITRAQLVDFMDVVLQIQANLSQKGIWNSECENIYLHCRDLQSTLEKKLCGSMTHEIQLDSDPETVGIDSVLPTTYFAQLSESDSSQTSRSRLTQSKTRASTSGIEALSHDEWLTDQSTISKLRKAYVSELQNRKQKTALNQRVRKWLAGIVEFIFPCACGMIQAKH